MEVTYIYIIVSHQIINTKFDEKFNDMNVDKIFATNLMNDYSHKYEFIR